MTGTVSVWVQHHRPGKRLKERWVELPAPSERKPDEEAFEGDEYDSALLAFWEQTLDPWWEQHSTELFGDVGPGELIECMVVEAEDPGLVKPGLQAERSCEGRHTWG